MNFLSWSRDFLASSRAFCRSLSEALPSLSEPTTDTILSLDFGLLYGGASFSCAWALKESPFSWLCPRHPPVASQIAELFSTSFATRQLYLLTLRGFWRPLWERSKCRQRTQQRRPKRHQVQIFLLCCLPYIFSLFLTIYSINDAFNNLKHSKRPAGF